MTLTTWFTLLMVINERLLSRYTINYLNSIINYSILLVFLQFFYLFINNLFLNILDAYVIIYLNNMLIYSNNMSKHYQHIKKVLKYLCKTGLYTKVEKYEFYFKLVEYLEYNLSLSSLSISLSKTGQSPRKSRIFSLSQILLIFIASSF